MKCVSCEVEINPKWRHAIDINVCPFCGKGIMEEHLKNLLTSLREVMEKLIDYPDQINDWMLSNFNFIKTDSPNKKYTVKVKTEVGEEEVVAEKVQSEDATSDFFKRAEVKLTIDKENTKSPSGPNSFRSVSEKTQYLKDMAQQIKKEGASGIVNETGLATMISPDMLEKADPEAVVEYQNLMTGGEVSSALPDSDDDEIPSVVMAMANKAKGKGGDVSAADLTKLREMQNRVKNSRANFESGDNRSGKNGFSRA